MEADIPADISMTTAVVAVAAAVAAMQGRGTCDPDLAAPAPASGIEGGATRVLLVTVEVSDMVENMEVQGVAACAMSLWGWNMQIADAVL